MRKILTQIAQWSAALMGGIALTACSKVVSFVEEVEIEGKTYRVERNEYFEKRPIELQWRDWWLESEITIKELGLPPWRGELSPMYIGKANNGQLVLVAVIQYDKTWLERGKPPNWYVAFTVDKNNRWIELPVPSEFAGRKASFLMAAHTREEKKLITKADRDFRNKISAEGRLGTIVLKP